MNHSEITYKVRDNSPAFMNLTVVYVGTVAIGTIGFDWESSTYFFGVEHPAGSIISGRGYESFESAEGSLLDASADYPAPAPATPWTSEELHAAGYR